MKYIILTFTHGSVRTVVDGDTGIEANDYYTFGKRIPLPVSGAVPVTEPVLTLAMIHPTCLHLCTKLLSKARKGDAIHPEKSALFTIY